MKLALPNPSQTVDKDGGLVTGWAAFFTRVRNWIAIDSQYGTTAQRPTTGLQPGVRYFDTTLGFIIHVKSVGPVVWVRYDGTVV